MRYVALLRGINVGRHKRISMPSLRGVFESAGVESVTTYLQSGNVVFTSRASASKLRPALEAAINADLGLEVPVLLRTPSQLDAVVAGNPFGPSVDASTLHVAFLSASPSANRLDPALVAPDEFRVVGREVYLRYPNGYGRSKLTNEHLETKLGVVATTRNWRTVTALDELARG